VISLDEYRQDKKRLEDEKKALELQKEKAKSDYTQANKERAIAKIREIWDAYHGTDSIADKKKLLMSFIESIVVHPDGVVEVNIYI
jgi:predicted  nucleic acid-binding Zn-ribbon protein